MATRGRRTGWHRLVLLTLLPLVLAVLFPVAAVAADDETAPPAPTSSQTAEPEPEPPVSEPSEPPTPETSDPTASEPPDVPEGDEAAPSEPAVAEEEEVTADVPTLAPSADAGVAQAAVKQQTKVTICHRTNSRTNPYNQIVVSESSAISGHASHRGPIFGPGVENWGDIIAPIRPGLPAGRNWPAGRAILNNGCEMQPDVGPLPTATVAAAECDGTVPVLDGTVTNDADATSTATIEILINGTVVETVGPLAPGESEDVELDGEPGDPLDGLEDTTVTVEARSGGEVIGSRVFTVDCEAGAPDVAVGAELACDGGAAEATVTVTNNGPDPVEVTGTVNGAAVGSPLVVGPGATETGTTDLSQYEDQTTSVAVLVDGAVVGSYTVTPDCVAPQAAPGVRVAGQECPPPSTTVTLANDGDPDSQVVFVIRVNGRVVQRSAPLYGGDATTIVGDLSQFEDQTVTVSVRANGRLLGRRTITVDCERSGSGAGTGSATGTSSGSGSSFSVGAAEAGPGTLPAVGAGFSVDLLALGLGLLGAGFAMVVAGRRYRRAA